MNTNGFLLKPERYCTFFTEMFNIFPQNIKHKKAETFGFCFFTFVSFFKGY